MKPPLVVERTYHAPIKRVWKALTDKDQMKEWYFELDEFRPQKGFKFTFTGGDEHVQFTHHCEVLEANPPHKLSYSWTYPDYQGYSVVTFELFEEGPQKTRVKLSHSGLDSFPQDNKNFGVQSFTDGWSFIMGESLKNFVETESVKKSVDIAAEPSVIWQILLNPGNSWGKAFGGGSFVESDWQVGSEVVWTDLSGEIGSRGLVSSHQPDEYLRVDMFDEVDAPAGSPTGEYAEQYCVVRHGEGKSELQIEYGQLQRKYLEDHGAMWDEALKIIKDRAERDQKTA